MDRSMDAMVESAWLEFIGTWGLTYNELIQYSFVEGDNPGDTVYTSPEGHEMSRFMCNYWIDKWGPFRVGFIKGHQKCHGLSESES